MQNSGSSDQLQNPYQSQPQQQPPYQAPPPTDGFAITSMVLGIIAVLTCYFGIILGTVAVIFGHVSLGKMKKDPNLGGKGMAVAGLATGYVAIAVSVVFGIMFITAANTAGGIGKEFIKQMEIEVEKERERLEKVEEQRRLENDNSREVIPDQE